MHILWKIGIIIGSLIIKHMKQKSDIYIYIYHNGPLDMVKGVPRSNLTNIWFYNTDLSSN